MVTISGLAAQDIIGKKDHEYAVPFFGSQVPLLVDMVFEELPVIQRQNYSVISKEEGTITAWTKAPGSDGEERILWMKATPLFDGRGIFIGVLGAIRDITHTLGPELLSRQAAEGTVAEKSETPAGQGNMFGRILGRAKAHYLQGLRLYYREGKYEEAIAEFDRALEIDPTHAFAWNDRGVCLRALEQNEEALESIAKAVELAPNEEEILYTCAETLRKLGVLRDDDKILSAAVDTYNRLLERNPSNADAWNNMGVCAQEMGREDLSRQYFERARNLKRYNKDRYRIRNLDTIV
jgi:hypothetical protein